MPRKKSHNNGRVLDPAMQERAIAALVACGSPHKAARAAGIDPSTIFRWMREDDFLRRYRMARRDAFRIAIAKAQSQATRVVDAMVEIALHGKTESARVAAGTTVLRFGREAIELDDIEERLEAVERALAGKASVNSTEAPAELPGETAPESGQ